MENSTSKQSRRRFLADMLFVGGGLTAAAVLAKTTLLKELTPVPPVTVGEMVAPPPLEATPAACQTSEPEISEKCVEPPVERPKTRDPMQPPSPGGVVAPAKPNSRRRKPLVDPREAEYLKEVQSMSPAQGGYRMPGTDER